MRDRSRSLFPSINRFCGRFLSVFLYSYINGVISEMVKSTAHYQTGHLRIMTQAYAKEANQNPIDLALIGVDNMMSNLNEKYSEMLGRLESNSVVYWIFRMKTGKRKPKGPVSGMAVNLFSDSSPEHKLLNIKTPSFVDACRHQPGEILIADEFAKKLNLVPGDTATLIGSTMYGSMTMANFKIAGTVQFGIAALDRGAIFTDISDIQYALDMDRCWPVKYWDFFPMMFIMMNRQR